MKLGIILCSIFLFSTVLQAEFPKPNFPSCSFYLDAEQQLSCAKTQSSYLIEYGHRYCKKFNEESDAWNDKLKKWVQNTGLCLQEMIYDNRDKRITPCLQLEEFAFDAHPICYKQYGICKLSILDRLKVARVIRFVDISTRKSLIQSLNVILTCLFEEEGLAESATYARLVEGSHNLSQKDLDKAAQIFIKSPIEKTPREDFFKKALSILLYNKHTPKGIDLYLQAFKGKKFTDTNIKNQFNSCLNDFSIGKSSLKCREFMYDSPASKKLDPFKNYQKKITPDQIEQIFQMIGPILAQMSFDK